MCRLVRRIAGCDRTCGGVVGIDQRAPLGRVVVREQLVERDVEEVRVGQEHVPVREGEARCLEEEVKRLGAVHAREVEALEDVERLAHGAAAARGWTHAIHAEAAVADPRGRPLD